jgi:arsenate reductase (thioredoxin)
VAVAASPPQRTCNVLFLCTGNSARSVLAECLANRLGGGRLRAWSAGSQPRGEVHPLTREVLRENGHDTSDLRSKSWDEFARPGAPRFDVIVTVCDQAAGETCPIWPGHPVQAHWSIEDPAAARGGRHERLRAFERAYRELEGRIAALARLPLTSLDREALRSRVQRLADPDAGQAGER